MCTNVFCLNQAGVTKKKQNNIRRWQARLRPSAPFLTSGFAQGSAHGGGFNELPPHLQITARGYGSVTLLRHLVSSQHHPELENNQDQDEGL